MPEESISSAVHTEPWTIQVGDKALMLSSLTPRDLASAEQYIRNERLQDFLEQTRAIKGVNLPDRVRGCAIGEIMNSVVMLSDCLRSFSGQMFLLFRSAAHNHPEMTFDSFMKIAGQVDIASLSSIMMQITGLPTEEDTDNTDPLGTNDSTSTGETSVQTFQGGKDT